MTHQSGESPDYRPVERGRRSFLQSLVVAAPLALSVGRAAARPSISSPTGYDHHDAAHLLATHADAVTDSASVHTNISYEATANGGASVDIVEAWTDYRRDEQLVNVTTVTSTGQRYAEDGTVYTKVATDHTENARYDRSPGSILVARSTGTYVLEKLLPYLEFEREETWVEDDRRESSYEATDFDTGSFSIYLREVETLRSFDASLTADARGRIHDFAFDLDAWGDDGNLLTVETTVGLDEFGRTTVRRPEWVETEFR